MKYLPVTHGVQDIAPGDDTYLPAAQPKQLVDTEAPVVVRY
jgi:hypothetical protein